MTGFFVETIAGYIIERGLDALIGFIANSYPVGDPRLSENDKAIVEHFRSSVPNTYQRAGVLFEVYVVEERSRSPQTIIIPRGFGESPTSALINEAVFNNKDIPELPPDIQRQWIERRARITELAERGDVNIDRSAFWWELDRVTRQWSVRAANLELAEDQAKRAIANGVSLANLSRAADNINALRANAAQWLNLREQAKSRIRDMETRQKINSLVDANERMVHEIDEALKDLKRAQEYQGFLSTLNMLSSLLKYSADFSTGDLGAPNQRMVALENYSITVIEKAGNEMRRLDVELKDIFGGYVTGTDIMPSFRVETIEMITRP